MLGSRRSRLLLVTLLLSLAAAIVAGCGDDSDEGLLSSERAARLQETLDGVEAATEAGDCGAARTQAARLETQVQSLPESTDADLETALTSGADHLQSLIDDRCAPDEPTDTTTTPPPATETTPEDDKQDDGDKKPPGQEGKEDKPKKDEGQGNDGDTQQPEEETEPPVTEEDTDETGGSGE